jgi:hypothetical protein
MSNSRKSNKKSSRSKSKTSKNKKDPVLNSDGSIKISMMKREYRLVEQHGDVPIVTGHKAFNKGPGDAAVKLAQPFFKDKNDGSKVRITITKVSPGRNQGAKYEYEIVQKLMPVGKNEKVPESIIIEKNGKQYRLKRYAVKIKTYTPTMMKRQSVNPSSSKKLASELKESISKIIKNPGSRGRRSKTTTELSETSDDETTQKVQSASSSDPPKKQKHKSKKAPSPSSSDDS